MPLVLRRFLAGFAATLVFHQAGIAALWALGAIPRTPFNMTPVPPLGVPSVLSLAFWGGIWGIAMLWALEKAPANWRLAGAVLIGALGPTLVAWFVVAPLKGRPLPTSLAAMSVGFLVNALWGLGTWLLMRLLTRQAGAAAGAGAPAGH